MSERGGRGQLTRARIIEAAREALLAGDGHFELTEAAKIAGVSAGAPYYHFQSKSALISAVVTEFYAGMARAADVSDTLGTPGTDWIARERVRLGRVLDYFYADPLSAIIISKLGRDPEAGAVEAALWENTIRAGERVIASAQRRKELALDIEPAVASAFVNGGIRHAIGLALAERPVRPKAQLSEELWAFISRMLKLRAPTKSR